MGMLLGLGSKTFEALRHAYNPELRMSREQLLLVAAVDPCLQAPAKFCQALVRRNYG